MINRPVSPLLLLTMKTEARWWERTAVSRDERKLQEERKGGCIIEMPYTHAHRYMTLLVEDGKGGGNSHT